LYVFSIVVRNIIVASHPFQPRHNIAFTYSA
jgi:hypothetical protein